MRHLWTVAAVLTAVLVAKVLVTILAEYRWYFPADFDSAFLSGRRDSFVGVYRAAFYGHIISGPIALALGSYLLFTGGWPGHQVRHRWAGRCQMLIVLLLLVPTGLMMAAHSHAGPVATFGFSALAFATAVCLLAAGWHAWARRWTDHQRWAARGWVLLCSPLLLRLFTGAAIVLQLDSVEFYRLNAWFSWLLPLAVYELWWRLRERNVGYLATLASGRST